MKRSKPLQRKTPLRSGALGHKAASSFHRDDLVELLPQRVTGWVLRRRGTRLRIELAEGPHKGEGLWAYPGQLRKVEGVEMVAVLLRLRQRAEAVADPAFTPPAAVHLLPALHVLPAPQAPRPLRPLPKPTPPARDPRYLAYVQGKPCAACPASAPSEAHHEGPRGVSQKASDYLTVPLCTRCHKARTTTNTLPGLSRDEARLLFARAQAALLAAWAESEASTMVTLQIVGVAS